MSRPKFTLAIDASQANRSHRTGVEMYAYRLIEAMKQDPRLRSENAGVTLYANEALHGPLGVLPDGWRESVLRSPTKYFWTLGRLSVGLLRDRPTVTFEPGDVCPITCGALATTVHDIAFRFFPEAYTPKKRAYLEWATRRAVSRADVVFTVSETTKDDLVRVYGINPSHVTVTPLAPANECSSTPRAEDEEVLRRYGVKDSYVLCIGRLERKKGTATLVRALCRDARLKELQLVLVGKPGTGAEEVYEAIERVGKDRVLVIPSVGADELPSLYRRATMCAVPSLYEGFGLPVLEAMASGTPVVASDIPVFREIGDGAIWFAEPGQEPSFSEAMCQVIDKKYEVDKLIKNGLIKASNYSWPQTARRTVDKILDLR